MIRSQCPVAFGAKGALDGEPIIEEIQTRIKFTETVTLQTRTSAPKWHRLFWGLVDTNCLLMSCAVEISPDNESSPSAYRTVPGGPFIISQAGETYVGLNMSVLLRATEPVMFQRDRSPNS